MPTRIEWRLLIAVSSTALLLISCSPAGAVVEITVVNGTAYDLDVEVSSADRNGWLPIAIVGAGSTDVSQGVLDQGATWIFRFRHWGDPVGEISLTRTDLQTNGWRVEVPESISEHIQELGRPPPP
jgi:hypothetical protein